jgi:hypothetical protein
MNIFRFLDVNYYYYYYFLQKLQCFEALVFAH